MLSLASIFLLAAGQTTVAAVPPQPFDASHARWDHLVKQYVHAGQVDYTGLRGAGRAELDGYLGELSTVTSTATWGRSDALAFWIDAYNAWTVKLIVDHPGVSSIKKITTVGSPWKLAFIPMKATGTDVISLDDIEHGVIRPTFADPRIHMAVVCASTSCPALRSEAYDGYRLDTQLDDQARRFLADPTRNTVDAANKVLRISSIFDWYGNDFDATGGVGAFLEKFGTAEIAQGAREGWTVDYMTYDWGLNGR